MSKNVQPTSLMARVMRLASNVSGVLDVSLVSCRLESNIPRGTLTLQPAFEDVQLVSADFAAGRLTCTLRFGFFASPTEAEASTSLTRAVNFEATFRVVYAMAQPDWATDEVVQSFALINGQLTTHPFWREVLQSMMTRCGFPPPVVPPYMASEALRRLDVPVDSSPVAESPSDE